MPITLTYGGDPQYTEIAEATNLAHAFLQDELIIELIEGRPTPFDDSTPADLDPDEVARYVRETNLALTVMDYRHSEGSTRVGGRYRPSHPNQIDINVLALPRRDACEFAGVLVHESIHALSRHVNRQTNGSISFTHIPADEREGNEGTAPYWIQEQAENSLCANKLISREPLLIEHEA